MDIYLTKDKDYWIATAKVGTGIRSFRGVGITQIAAVISLINIHPELNILTQQAEWKSKQL